MDTKKYLFGAGVAAIILSGVFSLAFAEMTGQTTTVRTDSYINSQTMIVQIGPKGKTLIRGTIKKIDITIGALPSVLTVTSWGGDWVINISSFTQLMPGSDMAQFKVGDFVGVQGIANQNASWTVDAKIVRDWTAKKMQQDNNEMMRKERHNNEQEIKEVISKESPRNWQGIASNINASGNSFTLTVDGVAYTVNLVTDAKIVNQSFLTASFANVKDKDTVRVWGPVSGTTISAYVLRDVSISEKSSGTNR